MSWVVKRSSNNSMQRTVLSAAADTDHYVLNLEGGSK